MIASQSLAGSSIRKDDPSLNVSECSMLQQLINSANRIRNIDNFSQLLSRFTLIARINETKSRFREFIYNIKLVKYEQEEVIYNKAVDERAFNIIMSGNVALYGHEHAGLRGTEATYIRSLRNNSYFGHTMELDGYQINQIKAVEPSFILQLNLKMMYKILDGILVFPEITEKFNFYKRLAIFKDLDKRKILKLVQVTQKRIFIINNVIYQQGTEPQFLYVVVVGQVSLYRKSGRHTVPVSTLGKFELLGLEEILHHKKYQFSAKALVETNILIQIPKATVLEVLDQMSIQIKLFETKSKLRQQRIWSAEQNIPETSPDIRKHSLAGSSVTRVSFRDKRRFHTDIVNSNAIQSRLNRIRKTSYLTNKREPFFQNQQEFFLSKINKFETIFKDRYGSTYDQKFFNLFQGYDNHRRHRRVRSRVHTAAPPVVEDIKKQQKSPQSSKVSSTKLTRTKWQIRSQSSHDREHSSDFMITQLNKRFIDVDECERRLSEKIQF